MFLRLAGEMPPPWSRMRIVIPGEEFVESFCTTGSNRMDSSGPDGGEEGDRSGEAAAAMVTSIGSRSLRFSTVARKAFLSSSVRMYSRCVGT